MTERVNTHLQSQNGSQAPLRASQSNFEGGYDHRTNTHQLDPCPNCNCITYTLMDDDGNRFCGKCKERKDNREW